MCLAVKYNRVFRGNKGYKLLDKQLSGHYATGMCGVPTIAISDTKFSRSVGKVIDMSGYNNGTYPAGFHIFTRKSDAQRVGKQYPHLALCRMEFKDQVAYGMVHWSIGKCPKTTTVVAKQCKIVEVIKNGCVETMVDEKP